MSRAGDRNRVAPPTGGPSRAWPAGDVPHRRPIALGAALALVRPHWPVLAVLGLYAAAAFVVPTLTPVATTDDWGYARSVEILYHERRLEVFPVVAATAVFQIAWGALFALLLGPDLGVFRLSTVVMVGLGGWAMYAMLRRLGVAPGRGALGVAAYLFNPLAFVLAFTFMTDPHFTALLLVATYFYVRGLDPANASAWPIVAGSAVAALAFLTRQQGALIPLAVVSYLLASRRLAPTRAGFALVARVVAIPAAVTVAYYGWLRFVNDVPDVQASFLQEATNAGWDGTWWLLRRLTVVELMYLGFFALPLAAAALPAVRRLAEETPRRGRLLFYALEAGLVAGLVATWLGGGRMPYVGQFFGAGGPGAPDVLGSRPRLMDSTFRAWLTIACALAALTVAVALCRHVGRRAAPRRAGAGLVLAILLWQAVGVLPPSYHYLNRGGSLDRYLLPLLPLSLCLLLWALRDIRLVLPLGWLAVAAFALVAIAGTRDYLVYMGAVWTMARDATTAGVPLDRLDAGSGWDGYHLYEFSRDNRIKPRTRGGPWWVSFYAPATDSTYVVSAKPLPGYVVALERDYSSWLETEPTRLHLLRRPDAPWPPRVPERIVPNRSGWTVAGSPWRKGELRWQTGPNPHPTATSS